MIRSTDGGAAKASVSSTAALAGATPATNISANTNATVAEATTIFGAIVKIPILLS